MSLTQKRMTWMKYNDQVVKLFSRHSDEDEDDDDDGFCPRPKNVNLGPCIIMPEGIIPIKESMIPSKIYNLWMGHTNFDLGEERRAERIAATPGVETVDFISRYRFRVGIGKMFDQDEVKKAIKDELTLEKAVKHTSQFGSIAIQTLLCRRYPFWAIYRLPDGTIKTIGGQSKEEVTNNGSSWAAVAAEVITSW